MTDTLVEELLDTDGIVEVEINKRVTVTVTKQIADEQDDSWRTIRERVVSEDELQSLANEHGWRYHGTVDVPNEFRLLDKFTNRVKMDGDSR